MSFGCYTEVFQLPHHRKHFNVSGNCTSTMKKQTFIFLVIVHDKKIVNKVEKE